MKDMVERINVEQGAITKHVGEMRAGVTGEEVRDIVRREVVDALDVRNVSMIPQPEMKNIIVQQNVESLIQEGRLNDAFKTTLSSNDLTLLVFTCELLNTTQVFNSATCPLFQSALLSLIKHLLRTLGSRQRSSMPTYIASDEECERFI
jgi:hypothetical protein